MQRSKYSSRGRAIWAYFACDRGSAAVEFLTIGLLLTVPLVYLVITLGQLQAASLAVEGAARQAARVIAAAPHHEQGIAAAEASIVVALSDVGLEPAQVSVTCAPEPSNCVTEGGTVIVEVAATVALPLAPAVLDINQALAVPMDASAAQPVSEF